MGQDRREGQVRFQFRPPGWGWIGEFWGPDKIRPAMNTAAAVHRMPIRAEASPVRNALFVRTPLALALMIAGGITPWGGVEVRRWLKGGGPMGPPDPRTAHPDLAGIDPDLAGRIAYSMVSIAGGRIRKSVGSCISLQGDDGEGMKALRGRLDGAIRKLRCYLYFPGAPLLNPRRGEDLERPTPLSAKAIWGHVVNAAALAAHHRLASRGDADRLEGMWSFHRSLTERYEASVQDVFLLPTPRTAWYFEGEAPMILAAWADWMEEEGLPEQARGLRYINEMASDWGDLGE